jgi:hypothetical protein
LETILIIYNIMSVADISLNVPGWYCKGYTTDAKASVVLEAWFKGGKTFSDIKPKINDKYLG